MFVPICTIRTNISLQQSCQAIGIVLPPMRASTGDNISLCLPPTVVQVQNREA